MNNIIPTADRVILKVPEGREKSAGGVIIPENTRDKLRPHEGLVVALGPGRMLESGRLVPIDPNIKVGSRVLYQKYSGSEITLDGDDIVIISETNILSVIRAEGSIEIDVAAPRKDAPLPSLKEDLAVSREQ